jgi:hypothetical protein
VGSIAQKSGEICTVQTDLQPISLKSDRLLGGGIVKKRIGLAGRGKRGGARTLIATNNGDRWFFVFGFEKNERANISTQELEALQSIAADLLDRTDQQLNEALENHSLQEICHDNPA